MNNRCILCLVCILALICIQTAYTATVSYNRNVSLATTNWTNAVSVPQFDPELGTLNSVEVSLAAHIEGSVFYENQNSQIAQVTSTLSAKVEVTGASAITAAIPELVMVETIPAFDGTVDFGGDSGKTYSSLSADKNELSTNSDPAFLAAFTGTGTTDLSVSASGLSKVSGPGNLAGGYRTKAQADITVVYNYTPNVSTIGDLVWIDTDGDKIFEPEAGELGVNGVLVQLYGLDGKLIADTYTMNDLITGMAGCYLFPDLPAGSYIVSIASSNFQKGGLLCDCAQTYDYDQVLDNQTPYSTNKGETFLEADFGYRSTRQIGTEHQGYWKNHPEEWPMESITIGGVTYSKDEAINLLKAPPAGDRTYKMFSSLACSILNIAIGNDPTCIEDVIKSADEWMAQYGPVGSGVKPNSKAWKNCDPLCDYLDDYNNGRLCAPRRK